MDLLSLLLLAVGLSMDAFAVSVCKGLALNKLTFKAQLIVGAWFGGFQFLMPMIGYGLSSRFERYIDAIAPWIAFGLLLLIGGNMVREALGKETEEANGSLAAGEMCMMAIATSIDALAVGVTFTCVNVELIASWSVLANTVLGCVLIGITTFLLSMIGVRVGSVFGSRYEKKAELAGGIILILLGVRILVEHFIG